MGLLLFLSRDEDYMRGVRNRLSESVCMYCLHTVRADEKTTLGQAERLHDCPLKQAAQSRIRRFESASPLNHTRAR